MDVCYIKLYFRSNDGAAIPPKAVLLDNQLNYFPI